MASCALKYPSPKEAPSPNTSPVERISGPKTGSTSGNILNGKTASFTPTCGITFSFNPGTGDSCFVIGHVIISVASLTMFTLHTFETKGTVRLALGLASST